MLEGELEAVRLVTMRAEDLANAETRGLFEEMRKQRLRAEMQVRGWPGARRAGAASAHSARHVTRCATHAVACRPFRCRRLRNRSRQTSSSVGSAGSASARTTRSRRGPRMNP